MPGFEDGSSDYRITADGPANPDMLGNMVHAAAEVTDGVILQHGHSMRGILHVEPVPEGDPQVLTPEVIEMAAKTGQPVAVDLGNGQIVAYTPMDVQQAVHSVLQQETEWAAQIRAGMHQQPPKL
ncbi:MAG: hypothetical protein KIH63_002220 [Candidatus Saccharibacteria bacterium]|nr:hypothetical protein [Candidatus Saccharibacteria bacterium]